MNRYVDEKIENILYMTVAIGGQKYAKLLRSTTTTTKVAIRTTITYRITEPYHIPKDSYKV